METVNTFTPEKVWNPDSFCMAFRFKKTELGFEKEINGEPYLFKQVSTPDELKEVVNVQKVAWGWEDRELAPVHILALWEDTGGGVFAAYNKNSKIVGFAAGMGGGIDSVTNKPILISSMLAIANPDFRSQGLGRELKIIQAYHAKLNGYDMMKWLYDPERGGNASINLRKLGAKCEEFYIDKYGQMLSQLYGPVPTDRFRAVWRFTESETLLRLTGLTQPPSFENFKNVPIVTANNLIDSEQVLVQISSDIDREGEKEKIARRQNLRKILSYYFFERQYIATEFVSKGQGQDRQNFYLLEPFSKLKARLNQQGQ